MSAILFFYNLLFNKGESILSLEVQRIEKHDLSEYISLNGSICSNDTSVTSSISYPISSINVAVGDYVNEGDLLFSIDSTELEEKYQNFLAQKENSDNKKAYANSAAERELENAKTEKEEKLNQESRKIKEAESKRDEAYASYNSMVDEYNSLVEKANNLYSQLDENSPDSSSYYQEYESCMAEYEEIYSKIENAKSTLSDYDYNLNLAYDSYNDISREYITKIQSCEDMIESGKYDVDMSTDTEISNLKKQIQQCQVYAPISGIITELNASVGFTPDGQELVTISSNEDYYVKAMVDERDISSIDIDSDVDIRLSTDNDSLIEGAISTILNVPTINENNSVEYEIHISFADDIDESSMYLGSTASVKIYTNKQSNIMSVPDNCIVSEDGNNYIYLALKDDEQDNLYMLKKVQVDLGTSSNYYVEIVSYEVEIGSLCVTNIENLDESSKYKITISN